MKFVLVVTPNLVACGFTIDGEINSSLCIYFSRAVSLSPCAATCHDLVLHTVKFEE